MSKYFDMLTDLVYPVLLIGVVEESANVPVPIFVRPPIPEMAPE